MPRRHDANKQMWRDFALLYDYKEGNHVAGVIQWVQRIAEEIDMQMVQTTIVSVQYGDKDFFCAKCILGFSYGKQAVADRHWCKLAGKKSK